MDFPKHEKILKLAAVEIGTHEDPMGSNTGARVQQYQHATWLGGTGWPWCAAFCCFNAEHAGFNLHYRGAGAYAWYDDGAKVVGKQISTSHSSEVVPGDFAVFKIGEGHIGIVEKIMNGVVHSIDGNVSDSVAREQRPLAEVYGFVHLDETPVTPPHKLEPQTFEVVSGLNGAIAFYKGGDAAHVAARIEAILNAHPNGVMIKPRPKK